MSGDRERTCGGLIGLVLTAGATAALCFALAGIARSGWRLKRRGPVAIPDEAGAVASWVFVTLFAAPVLFAGLLLAGALLPGPYFGN